MSCRRRWRASTFREDTKKQKKKESGSMYTGGKRKICVRPFTPTSLGVFDRVHTATGGPLIDCYWRQQHRWFCTSTSHSTRGIAIICRRGQSYSCAFPPRSWQASSHRCSLWSNCCCPNCFFHCSSLSRNLQNPGFLRHYRFVMLKQSHH